MEQKFQWIGARVKRNEDPRFLTGRGNYIDDIKIQNLPARFDVVSVMVSLEGSETILIKNVFDLVL